MSLVSLHESVSSADWLEWPPVFCDDGFRRLESALAAHGLGARVAINLSEDPLPAALLSQARLRSMTPEQLYLHEPSAGAAAH